MRLSGFITSNLDRILADWVAFARLQEPAASHMDERELLDHGRMILQEIAADMRRPQDEEQRQAKSEGSSDTASTSQSDPSRSHARQRARHGFLVEQMVAEYRALRATVIRLWSASSGSLGSQDLEDVIRFNEAIDQAIAESLGVFLVEVDKTRDLFLGMLCHDLRGPLATISACVSLTRKSEPNESPTVAIVLRSVFQLKALLDDLEQYTRHRLGCGLTVHLAPLHLEQFARDTLSEIEAVSPGRVLKLEVLGHTEGNWDARRLHQAISNLVFNALKYGYPDSPVDVTVDGRSSDEVILTVENTGKPISPELLTKIFDPLVRTEEQERHSDSQVAGANLGLGLYVVREIATAHGGTVHASSNESITRFELRLPRG